MILVFGKAGQLASAFRATIPGSYDAKFLSSQDLDLSVPGRAASIIADHKPQLIINCAAYTAVDKAEHETALNVRLNAELLAEVGIAALKTSSRVLHFSTDYVFDGRSNSAHAENDPKGALNAYGRAKLKGERALADSGAFFQTIRISWVYSSVGTNFVKTMLRLGSEREELRVVSDQIGAPMSAPAVADLLWRTSAKSLLDSGSQDRATYNLSSGPNISWFDFACAIFDEAKRLGFPLKVQRVLPIKSSEFPTPASRPANSTMSDEKFKARYGLGLPDWRSSLNQVLVELKSANR